MSMGTYIMDAAGVVRFLNLYGAKYLAQGIFL